MGQITVAGAISQAAFWLLGIPEFRSSGNPVSQDQNNRWMIILEVSIALLFVKDLVILLAQLAK